MYGLLRERDNLFYTGNPNVKYADEDIVTLGFFYWWEEGNYKENVRND